MPCLLTGRLFDVGYFRLPLAIASVVLVVAAFLTAQCTQYWHFLLCQGIAVGVRPTPLSLTYTLTSHL
jgi:MCP family monocarboxylic acid transporter-like MFS transporter 10